MYVYDSHAYIKKLMRVGCSEEQAEIHADQFKEIIEVGLATKGDINGLKKDMVGLRNELKVGLAETESCLIKWMVGCFVVFATFFVTGMKF